MMPDRIAERLPAITSGVPHFCMYCNSQTRGPVDVIIRVNRRGIPARLKRCLSCRDKRSAQRGGSVPNV